MEEITESIEQQGKELHSTSPQKTIQAKREQNKILKVLGKETANMNSMSCKLSFITKEEGKTL